MILNLKYTFKLVLVKFIKLVNEFVCKIKVGNVFPQFTCAWSTNVKKQLNKAMWAMSYHICVITISLWLNYTCLGRSIIYWLQNSFCKHIFAG